MSHSIHTSPTGNIAAAAFFGACIAMSSAARAQDGPINGGEARVALDAALDKVADVERDNATLRQSNEALTKSLAAANLEARDARKRLEEIRLELEALGVSALGEDNRELSQRLLKALGAIEQERVYRQALEAQLVSLSESTYIFLNTVKESDAAARASLEAQMRATDSLLSERRDGNVEDTTGPADTGLANASVISLKPELGLAVLNAGKKSGVQIGMPFEIFRNDRILGAALVVDVRDHICGLAFGGTTEGLSEVKVGDRARPRIGR